MQRREFITLLGGAAAAWPFSVRAQQPDRIKRVGWLAGGLAENDPESKARRTAFVQSLRELGWTEGQNIQIDYRWGAGNADVTRKYAAELVALAPDVTLGIASQAVSALQQASRTIPIIFVLVPDPIGAGFVDSLARPGGNATGFTTFDYGFGGKWLEAAQGDRARRQTSGCNSRPHESRRQRTVGSNPVDGVFGWGRIELD
jgi:ABC transporter substrate binding protein